MLTPITGKVLFVNWFLFTWRTLEHDKLHKTCAFICGYFQSLIHENYFSNILFFSLNTRYGIVGVPTIILFQESRPVARFNRSRTYKDLVEFIYESTGLLMSIIVPFSEA